MDGNVVRRAILDFAEQFRYEPLVLRTRKPGRSRPVIVMGMGGSHLPGGLVAAREPSLGISLHKSYGLPPLPKETLKDSLLAAISYSGETEETLDAFDAAVRAGFPPAAIGRGGTLIARAEERGVPTVILPSLEAPSRLAAGVMVRALLKVMGANTLLEETSALAETLKPSAEEKRGETLANQLRDRVPLVYASSRNAALAEAWKATLNETGKIPAFVSVFPELLHHEIEGFDPTAAPRELVGRFAFVFLEDGDDHPRIRAKVAALEERYLHAGYRVLSVPLEGEGFLKLFRALILGHWVAYHTAVRRGVDPDRTPLIEDLKGLR